ADELFPLLLGPLSLGDIVSRENHMIRAERGLGPCNQAQRSILRLPIMFGLFNLVPGTVRNDKRTESAAFNFIQRITKSPLERAAGLDNLLLGIEHDDDAVCRVEHGG